jgi:WD40 repeat protein
VDKADAYEQVLEFARVQKAGDPYGFRFEEQEYWLRQKGGGVKTARFAWNEQLMADLQALAREEPDPEVARRLGEQLRRFLDELDWGGHEPALRGRRAPRLVVRSAAAELYALPWELVTVEGSGQHLVDLPGSSLRYEWPGEREGQEAGAAVQEGRVLLAWSAAGGRVPVEGHLRALEEASQQGDFTFDAQRDVLGRVSLRSLEQRLKSAREPVSVLHVLCHGSAVEASASRLYGLAWNAPREGDGVEVVDGGRLAAVLAPYAGTLRMVVLCACHGGDGGKLASHLGSVAQALHRVGIEMVVASRLPLSVEGSVLLAETLYEQLLGESSSLEEALGAARRRLRVEGRGLDWASLQLYARGDGDADSRPLALRPYRGLLAFEPKHQRFFFGRGRLRDVLLERVRQAASGTGARWQVVVGASGTGKSSVVLAGVVPRLAQEEWDWRVVRPGELVRAEGQAGSSRPGAVLGLLRRLQLLGSSEPVPTGLDPSPEALVEAVRRLRQSRPGRKLLLVVDQLEEIFTQLGREDRQALMRGIWLLARERELGCVVVATLRTDHLERCEEVMLGDGMRLDAAVNSEQHRVFMKRLGPEELAEVIEQPAHRVGLELEPGLMDRLRKDVEPEPGGLPLVEHTLELLWQRRQGQRLTHKAYEELGGVAGALMQLAERQHEGLSESERQQMRRLLVRLATLRELSTSRAQGRAWVEELRPREGQARESFDAVVEKLVSSRLLVKGGQEEGEAGRGAWMQLAHELLPRHWKRLGQWVEEDWERERQLREQDERRRQEEERERLRREAEAPQAPQAPQNATKGAECILLAEQFRAKEPSRAVLFLREVSPEARNQRWMSTALEVLQQPVARVVLRGHGGAVRKVAFSPDGQQVVTASADKTARVWSTEGKLLAALQAHSQEVLAVAFSPDGQRVVTASMDGMAWVWSTDGKPLAALVDTAHQVNTAVFSPDGQRVVTASVDMKARVWSLDGRGRLQATLQGHSGGVQMAAFSPDGQQVVTASLDKTARVWSTQGELRAKLAGHTGWVNSAAFSPDGQQVVTASQDGTARIWKVDGEPLAMLTGHGTGADNSTGLTGVLTAVFSPDGKRVVTASQDGTARVWEASSGRLPQVSGRTNWSMFARLAGHTGWVFSAAFSPDGQRVITVSEDGTARVWDVKEPLLQDRLLGTLVGHGKGVQSLAVSPDSQQVVTASKDGTARIWRLNEAGVLATLAGHERAVSWAAFSPDGQRVVTASEDDTARVWSAEGQLLTTLKGHVQQVTMAAFSPDGQWVVTASRDAMARVWSANGEPRVTLSGHRGAVWSAAFSPDGQRLVTASDDGTARVWSTKGELQVTLQGHIQGMPSAAFSPDGQRVVTASMDGKAQVWSASGELLITLQGHKSGVLKAAFSPDGKRVVTASMDGTARVWSAEGQLLTTLEGHGTEQVSSAAFSPDGQWVVTASRDKTARIWSAGGRLLATLRHKAWVGSAAFSVDGERLVTACSDGKARVWPMSVKLLGEYLEAATRDRLSPQEREEYLDDPPE